LVTAWVCLGEGMVAFYADLGGSARDKFLRAHALGTASRNQAILCLSSAWLAHMCYLDQDFRPMILHLGVALTRAAPEDYLSRERSSLVVAQAYHWANRFDLAQPWYERAHSYATGLGDETLLSALMHNMHWLHMSEARRLSLLGTELDRSLPRILLGAEAAGNFDEWVGTQSLKTLIPILRAHILSVLGRYEEALTLFDENLREALKQGLARIECSSLAEVAWCNVEAGRTLEARRFATAAQQKLTECSQPDELAATHGRLAQTFRKLNEELAAEIHAGLALSEWRKHEVAQLEVIELLSSCQAVNSRQDWQQS